MYRWEAAVEGRGERGEKELIPKWKLWHKVEALGEAGTGGKGVEKRGDTRRESQGPMKRRTEGKVGMREEVKEGIQGIKEERKGVELGIETTPVTERKESSV